MKNIITLEEKNQIDDICKRYNILNYKINGDGSIDVDGNVDLSIKKLSSLPLRFNVVTGSFYCHINKLTTLEGAPSVVGKAFYCQGNWLRSLEYCPVEVRGDFNCSANRLKSLEFCPKEISGQFSCSENHLTTLEYAPRSVEGSFYCNYNKLTSLFGCPEIVKNNFECSNNESLTTLIDLNTTSIGKYFDCTNSNLPTPLSSFLENHDRGIRRPEAILVFIKYQKHFDIWTPEFNEDNFNELIAEINDGLE